MKILNNKKTHFMQPGKDGHRNVEFGTVNEVQALINCILDGKQEKQSIGNLHALENQSSEKPNH